MKAVVTIRPTPGKRTGPVVQGIERARVQVEELSFDIPEDSLGRFDGDLMRFVRDEMPDCLSKADLTVVIPHDVSWDYIQPITNWVAGWRQLQAQRA